MSMERDKIPGEGHEPPLVNDAPDDARHNRTEGWGPVHYAFVIVALLMLLAGALWLGELAGLIAAVLPGGAGAVAGAVYGALGLLGLLILLWAIGRIRAGNNRRGK
jgi:hypothetical protein